MKFLDFEQPIAELEDKIDALESVKDDADIAKEMDSLKLKSELLTKKIFTSLSDWQISQLARHPQRLYTLDFCTVPLLWKSYNNAPPVTLSLNFVHTLGKILF